MSAADPFPAPPQFINPLKKKKGTRSLMDGVRPGAVNFSASGNLEAGLPGPQPEQPAQVGSGARATSSDRFGAYHAYFDQTAGASGWRKSGKDRKAGWVAQSGPYKGMTMDEARVRSRQDFSTLSDDQKARYQNIAQGSDIAYEGGDQEGLAGRPVGDATFSGLDELAAMQRPRQSQPERPRSDLEGRRAVAALKLQQEEHARNNYVADMPWGKTAVRDGEVVGFSTSKKYPGNFPVNASMR